MKPLRSPKPKSAFTLLELLIVIAILAVIASASFIAVKDNQDQASYEETVQRQKIIFDAIVGPDSLNVRNGAPTISGFVSDIGGIPGDDLPDQSPSSVTSGDINTSDTTTETLQNSGLNELIENPIVQSRSVINGGMFTGNRYKIWSRIGRSAQEQDIPAYSVFRNFLYSNIKIEHGWRGPYLTENTGTGSSLFDFWGNLETPFVYALKREKRSPAPAGSLPVMTFELFSMGKDSLDDRVAGRAVLSAAERAELSTEDLAEYDRYYEEDYPVDGAKEALSTRFRIQATSIPSEFTIYILKSKITDTDSASPTFGQLIPSLQQQYMLGTIYPGINLEDSLIHVSSGRYHPSLNLAHEDVDVGAENHLYGYQTNRVTLDLLEPADPAQETIDGKEYYAFETKLLEGPGVSNASLFFNKPFAWRHQLVLYKVENPVDSSGPLASASNTLASRMVSVHPQVFTFIPKGVVTVNALEGLKWICDY